MSKKMSDMNTAESHMIKSSGHVTELASGEADKLRELLESSMKSRDQAYCPYSSFRVGAAVLSEDGRIFMGCNVENASYGLTLCAERVAICNAVANGFTKFKAIAVCCDIKSSFKGPCGACRQTLVEFGTDWSLYTVKPDGLYIELQVSDLLPLGFHPKALQEERV